MIEEWLFASFLVGVLLCAVYAVRPLIRLLVDRDRSENPPDPDSFPVIVIEAGRTVYIPRPLPRHFPGIAITAVPEGHLRTEDRRDIGIDFVEHPNGS